MNTIWSVVLNRVDNLSPVWKEWRMSVLSQSAGAASAGAIPMLGADGKLDPSMVSGGGVGVELSTNGVENPVQGTLNLVEGANISLTADSSGNVVISTTAELAQVNSDWDATTGVAEILNKPVLSPVATSGSYTDLTHKPNILTPFSFTQNSPSTTWVVVHNLNTYPGVTVVDSAGSYVIGEVQYDSLNQCTLIFSGAMSGSATLI